MCLQNKVNLLFNSFHPTFFSTYMPFFCKDFTFFVVGYYSVTTCLYYRMAKVIEYINQPTYLRFSIFMMHLTLKFIIKQSKSCYKIKPFIFSFLFGF